MATFNSMIRSVKFKQYKRFTKKEEQRKGQQKMSIVVFEKNFGN